MTAPFVYRVLRKMSSRLTWCLANWQVVQSMPFIATVLILALQSAQEMFQCLVNHGCTDLSSVMRPDRYYSDAIARGGFGGIWKGELANGLVVAIKCVWLPTALDGDPKDMKVRLTDVFMHSQLNRYISAHRERHTSGQSHDTRTFKS